MHPKTIEHLVLVDFQEDYSDTDDYYEAFDYVVNHLFPRAKRITLLYNGLDFDYYDDELEKEVTHVGESLNSFISHFENSNVVGLMSSAPRIVKNNMITPLTKDVDIIAKTFYYIRPWINLGFPDRTIMNGLRRIIEEDKDFLVHDGKVLRFPFWFDFLDDRIGQDEEVTLVGGFEKKCLLEIEYLLNVYNILYTIDYKGVFGKAN